MSRLILHPDCVFQEEQFAPLLRTLRARVTIASAAFRRHSADLRRVTLRDPLDALIHASAVAVAASRLLWPALDLREAVTQALEIGGMSDQQVPPDIIGPALAVHLGLIQGCDLDPVLLLGNEPEPLVAAAVVQQVLAVGYVLLAAELEELPAAEVMDELQVRVLALTPTGA